MRKFIAMLLMAAMLLTSAVAFADTESGETAVPVTEPSEPGKAEEPAKPAETEKPSEPEKPAETEKPTETEKPEETEAPAETEEPAPTEEPAETEKPTEKPEETRKPANTEEPTAAPTAAPEETEAPAADKTADETENFGPTFVARTATAEESELWWNILLLGGDSRTTERYDRTDSMIILSVNRETGEIKMTSIMRDTWVAIPGHKGMTKINAANVYGGPERAVETVNSSFGTDIEDYVLINMAGMIKVIDAMGGIDIEVTERELEYLNNYAKEMADKVDYEGDRRLDSTGMVHLNGLLALSYARIRYADSDYRRVMRQQTVLMELAKKASALDAAELLKLVPKLLGMTETNLSMGEAMALATLCMNSDMSAIQQYRIPVDGTYKDGMFGDTWCIKPNFEKNARLLHDFIYTITED